MIYDVNSPLFRSFLSQKGGTSDKRGTIVSYKYLQLSQAGSDPAIFPNYYSIGKLKSRGQRNRKPKANENKPVMNE
nr:Wound-induced basic protein [Ipomoea batatas]